MNEKWMKNYKKFANFGHLLYIVIRGTKTFLTRYYENLNCQNKNVVTFQINEKWMKNYKN